MKKNNNQHLFARIRSRRLLVMVACTLGLIIILWLIAQPMVQKHNFENARKSMERLATQLSQAENSLAFTDQNSCYQSEQGPLDNGRLWCGVGASARLRGVDYVTAKKISDTVMATTVREYSDAVYGDYGSNVSQGSIETRTTFKESGIGCKVTATYEQAHDSALYVSATCSDRAKMKYYPYHP